MAAPVPLSVVKIGGSLVSDPTRLRDVLASIAGGAEGRAVIVPGGGPFAEAVRVSQASLGYSDALAHRLALDAMGRMAEVFCELEPRLVIVRSVEAAAAHHGACLWDPAALRDGHPGIAEGWDVTSDSLALWLATALGAARCILLKSAPCPAEATPDELARRDLVDAAFPSFASAFAGEIELRGPDAASHPHPHPEAPQRSGGLEGELQESLCALEPSFEARLCLAPQDEGVSGISSVSKGAAA